MSIVNDIFDPGFELYKFLTQKAKSKNVVKQLIIRELRNNLQRLEHRNRKGVDRKMLIGKLENVAIGRAIEEGFNFRKISSEKIGDDIIEAIPWCVKYRLWDASKLIFSIDEKITALQDLPFLYNDINNAPINITARLNNLYLQAIALTVIIKKT